VEQRLQKILSAAGIASRRAAETYITDGRVSVNGATVTTLGAKADPEVDEIRVDGRRIKTAARRLYILMYKPRGYITSRSDPRHRPTVIDLLARGGVRDYVYPVGRLDYDSEGLLLLTSDGDLAAHLTHPSHEIEREYQVQVLGVPDEHDLQRLANGIVIDGRRTLPAEVKVVRVIEGADAQHAVLSIVVKEGRNRQVRNMCEAVGHPVDRLRRVRIGPITDEHIRPGEFRELDAREVAALKKGQGTTDKGPGKRPRPDQGAGGKRRPASTEKSGQKRAHPQGPRQSPSLRKQARPEVHQTPHRRRSR
jgi:23S rRNA pseudouridine2605 synthase